MIEYTIYYGSLPCLLTLTPSGGSEALVPVSAPPAPFRGY